jgi:NADPH-dependent F420 reductase
MASITLIGSGNMARGIGSRAVAAGYDIQVLDRDPAKADSLARDLAGAGSGSLADAPTGDIVVLALPYTAVQEVLGQLGSQLDGRTVVDITNPVDFETFAGLVVPQDSSAAQEIAKLLPNAQIVKAFNTTFAATLADGSVSDQPLDVLIAGDDQGAKDAVATFVEAAGMRPLDVGPLTQAHWLEGVGFLHMGLQVTKGWGWNTGVKIIGA